MTKDKKNEKKENNENEEVVKIDLKTSLMLIAISVIILIMFLAIYKSGVKRGKEVIDETVEQQPAVTMTEFNEDDAIKLLTRYLEEKSLAMSSPQALLEKYGFATNIEFSNYEKTADETFIKTDILYEDIRTKMQDYITKELFTKEFKTIYKSSNGVTHVANLNNPKQTYSITRHQIDSSKNKPTIQVWYTTTQGDTTTPEKNMKVEFSQINGKWIISNIS